MALESFIVALKEDSSPQDTDRVVSIINNLNGKVGIITAQRKIIIATFDNSCADRIRKLPYVKLVGGVRIGKRKMTRKQIIKQ